MRRREPRLDENAAEPTAQIRSAIVVGSGTADPLAKPLPLPAPGPGAVYRTTKCGRAALAQVNVRAPHLYILVLIGLAIGCAKSGQDIAPVSGRVTLDGQPLQFAIVTFQPEGKSAASSGTDKDGRYELAYKRGMMGAPLGMSRVSILLDVEQAHRSQIPPQTDLKREVKPGPNVFDFDLTSNAK